MCSHDLPSLGEPVIETNGRIEGLELTSSQENTKITIAKQQLINTIIRKIRSTDESLRTRYLHGLKVFPPNIY